MGMKMRMKIEEGYEGRKTEGLAANFDFKHMRDW